MNSYFLSKFAKADMEFQNDLKSKMLEELETPNNLQRTIGSSMEQMTQKSKYIPRNDLLGSADRMIKMYNAEKDQDVEKILLEFRHSAENSFINPADCDDLKNKISTLINGYKKFKIQIMEQYCQETYNIIDSYSKNL